MQKIHEVLRLYHQSNMSERAIVSSLLLSGATVGRVINRSSDAGIAWQSPGAMSETELERTLFPRPKGRPQKLFLT